VAHIRPHLVDFELGPFQTRGYGLADGAEDFFSGRQ
jgi:hypothetical protein